MRLILASSSPYRRRLLERLGLPFLAVTPRFEEIPPESAPQGREIDAEALVMANARGKARSLLSDHPGELIIGSDQVAVCDGRILTKPGTAERAVEQLLHLAGREHRLLTGLVLIRAPRAGAGLPREAGTLVTNRLRLRSLSRAEAESYVRRERPLDCAGAYKSEGLGITLFEHMRGDDPTAIVGLPLIALSRLLREFGLDPLGLARAEDSADSQGSSETPQQPRKEGG